MSRAAFPRTKYERCPWCGDDVLHLRSAQAFTDGKSGYRYDPASPHMCRAATCARCGRQATFCVYLGSPLAGGCYRGKFRATKGRHWSCDRHSGGCGHEWAALEAAGVAS